MIILREEKRLLFEQIAKKRGTTWYEVATEWEEASIKMFYKEKVYPRTIKEIEQALTWWLDQKEEINN
jgi:hypothetical protein